MEIQSYAAKEAQYKAENKQSGLLRFLSKEPT